MNRYTYGSSASSTPYSRGTTSGSTGTRPPSQTRSNTWGFSRTESGELFRLHSFYKDYGMSVNKPLAPQCFNYVMTCCMVARATREQFTQILVQMKERLRDEDLITVSRFLRLVCGTLWRHVNMNQPFYIFNKLTDEQKIQSAAEMTSTLLPYDMFNEQQLKYPYKDVYDEGAAVRYFKQTTFSEEEMEVIVAKRVAAERRLSATNRVKAASVKRAESAKAFKEAAQKRKVSCKAQVKAIKKRSRKVVPDSPPMSPLPVSPPIRECLSPELLSPEKTLLRSPAPSIDMDLENTCPEQFLPVPPLEKLFPPQQGFDELEPPRKQLAKKKLPIVVIQAGNLQGHQLPDRDLPGYA